MNYSQNFLSQLKNNMAMESFLEQLPLNYSTLPCTQIFYFQFNGDDYEKGIAARRVHRKVNLIINQSTEITNTRNNYLVEK